MLITNGTFITWERENRILEGQAIYIEDGVIREIAPEAELKAKYPDTYCVHELFQEQVEKNPQAVAIEFGRICVSYHDLNEKANQVAKIPNVTRSKAFCRKMVTATWVA